MLSYKFLHYLLQQCVLVHIADKMEIQKTLELALLDTFFSLSLFIKNSNTEYIISDFIATIHIGWQRLYKSGKPRSALSVPNILSRSWKR
jgi:hypothetical protein